MKVLILLLLLPFVTKSQTFEMSKNTYLNENYIRYYDPPTGIIIQKVTTFNQDTSDTYYEIGLTVYSRVRSSDDFMKKNGLIVFEDKSYLQFTEQININYFQEGKHQYSIKHILSDADLKYFSQK
ncbi:MAG: hypothetical protein IPK57_17510 [Chitinophagaceae bacterium]|nr:hypothetical protein [Chitinophagaceae bacterium]